MLRLGRIQDARLDGLLILNYKSNTRLESCEIFGNGLNGVRKSLDGNLTLTGCTIRDHAGRSTSKDCGCGLYLEYGVAMPVMTGCVFARNAKGDVVREHF